MVRPTTSVAACHAEHTAYRQLAEIKILSILCK
jgi:hypothetical protein